VVAELVLDDIELEDVIVASTLATEPKIKFIVSICSRKSTSYKGFDILLLAAALASAISICSFAVTAASKVAVP